MKKISFLFVILSAVAVFSKGLVVTEIAAVESVLKELTAGTDIVVRNPIPEDMTFAEFQEYWDSHKKLLDTLANKSDVVFGIWSFLPNDNLYILLRSRNIRVVGIDCASPMLERIRGIGRIYNKKKELNFYIWLSPSNIMKMTEIMSKALILLYPEQKKKILNNASEFKEKIFKLKADYVEKFSQVINLDVITFDNDFDYFLKDMECNIIGNFSYDDVSGSDSLAKAALESIKQSGVKVIINKWSPLGIDAIDQYCEKNGVRVAVLKNGNPASSGLENGIYGLLKSNMEELLKAFKGK